MSHLIQRSQVPHARAGILFDHYAFSEPMPLGSWAIPQIAGIYAILVPDQAWKPKPFRVVCFEEAANVAEALARREKTPAWIQAAGSAELYFSVHLTPFATAAERAKIRMQLLHLYAPVHPCDVPTEASLATRLQNLESKYEEHEAQFKIVIAALARFLQPGPEPPKRHIGFV